MENSVSTTADEATKAIERKIKVRIFTGFVCFLLSGFSTFILNLVRGSKVPIDKMLLTDNEKLEIEVYMNSDEVLQFIDKLPTSVIGFVHISYMMFQKHSSLVSEYKIIKKEKTK